jgi:hypothetical protein
MNFRYLNAEQSPLRGLDLKESRSYFAMLLDFGPSGISRKPGRKCR